MPRNEYVKIIVGDQQAEVTNPNDLPISIDYSLEDPDDFQSKTSGESFDIEIPATLLNDRISNTYRNASVEDLTTGQIFRGNRVGVIEANGYQLLTGKAFLKAGTHNLRPISYKYNLYGDNADWLVELKDKTLYDFLQNIAFVFDKSTIEASWLFDGTDENLPYVFAPVRYRLPFNNYIIDDNGILKPDDGNIAPDYMRPSLSKYWIIYWAFKSVGYKIVSTFLDSEYFRRQVMPWTWGDFFDSDGSRLDAHKFLAKSTDDFLFTEQLGGPGSYVDLHVTNDSTDGAFDNNDEYSYNTSTFEMTWEYKPPDFGPLIAGLSAIIGYKVRMRGNNDDMGCWVDWFVQRVGESTPTFEATTPIINQDSIGLLNFLPISIGTQNIPGQTEVFFKTPFTVNVGDKVIAKVKLTIIS
jgi:hypothetical protein